MSNNSQLTSLGQRAASWNICPGSAPEQHPQPYPTSKISMIALTSWLQLASCSFQYLEMALMAINCMSQQPQSVRCALCTMSENVVEPPCCNTQSSAVGLPILLNCLPQTHQVQFTNRVHQMTFQTSRNRQSAMRCAGKVRVALTLSGHHMKKPGELSQAEAEPTCSNNDADLPASFQRRGYAVARSLLACRLRPGRRPRGPGGARSRRAAAGSR